MDLSTAQTRLNLWLAAEAVCAEGRSFAHGDRSLTHHNLAEIRAQISYWQRIVDAYTTTAAGGNMRSSQACWNSCS